MKISQLIEELQKLKDKYGDLEVKYSSYDGEDHCYESVNSVDTENIEERFVALI